MNNYPQWKTLLEFTHWFKNSGYPQDIPEGTKPYQTDVSTSVCIFRSGLYQVEFYIAKPNFVSSKHFHPFEQAIIFMGGTGKGRRGTNLEEEPQWAVLDHQSVGKSQAILMPNQWHQIASGKTGLYFYNCQRWYDQKLMTSAVVEYIGPSLGPIHNTIKK